MKRSKIALALTMALGLPMFTGINVQGAVYNGWEQSNGCWYYYENGSMCTGWKNVNDSWYYLNGDGSMKTGWLNSNGTWYYLNYSGDMATGWKNVNGSWYYMNNDGSMKTGWLEDKKNNTWYYLNPNGDMATGWVQSNGKWYYFESNGSMKTGEFQDNNGRKYYLVDDGAMKTGWFEYTKPSLFKPETVTMYIDSNGNIKTGWLNDNGKWYYFSEMGELTCNIDADGYFINRDGIWDKTYDGKVVTATDKASYYVYETGDIVFSIVNNTDSDINYNNEMVLEEKNDGQWSKVLDFEGGSTTEQQVKAKSAKKVGVDFSSIQYKLDEGRYRIGVKVNGQYMYGEFDMTKEDKKDEDDSKKDAVTMSPEKNWYYISDTDYIPFTITNNSNKDAVYTGGYSLEKLNGSNNWDKVSLKNVAGKDESFTIKPGKTGKTGIKLSDAAESLNSGKYRIVKTIGSQKVYGYFSLASDNIVTMQTEHDYYFEDDDKIEITIKNNGDKDISFGNDYRIESHERDGWKQVPFVDDTFEEGTTTLKPHEKKTETIDLKKVDQEKIGSGSLRIVKVIDGKEYYAECTYGIVY